MSPEKRAQIKLQNVTGGNRHSEAMNDYVLKDHAIRRKRSKNKLTKKERRRMRGTDGKTRRMLGE